MDKCNSGIVYKMWFKKQFVIGLCTLLTWIYLAEPLTWHELIQKSEAFIQLLLMGTRILDRNPELPYLQMGSLFLSVDVMDFGTHWGKKWTPCANPIAFSGLVRGQHISDCSQRKESWIKASFNIGLSLVCACVLVCDCITLLYQV